MDIKKSFKALSESIPYLKDILIGLVIMGLMVGVFVEQATSGAIAVPAAVNAALTSIGTAFGEWTSAVIGAGAVIIGLIILVVIMALFDKKKKAEKGEANY